MKAPKVTQKLAFQIFQRLEEVGIAIPMIIGDPQYRPFLCDQSVLVVFKHQTHTAIFLVRADKLNLSQFK